MFSLRGRHDTFDCFLSVVVGSGSVRAALFVPDEEGKTNSLKIAWSLTTDFMTKGDDADSALEHSLKEALLSLTLAINGEGLKTVRKDHPNVQIGSVDVYVTAPWSTSEVNEVVYNKDTSFTLTKKLLKTLEQKADQELSKKLNASEFVIAKSSFDRSTSTLLVNGYRIEPEDVPLNDVTQLSFQRVATHMHPRVKSVVEDVLEKTLGHREINFTPLLPELIRNTLTQSVDNSFLIFHITYGCTECVLVRDKVLVDIGRVKKGSMTLVQEVAKATKQPPKTAEVLLFDVNQKPTKTQAKKIKEIVAAYTEEISQILTTIGGDVSAPHRVYIAADSFFSEVLVKELTSVCDAHTLQDTQVSTLSSLLEHKGLQLERKRETS